MLRRRFDANDEKTTKCIADIDTPFKISIHSVSSLFAVVIIISGVLLFDFVVKFSQTVPTSLKIADEANYPERFIGERALNHLTQLTSIGPKVTGSYENEVLAVEFLKREIGFITQQANKKQHIELDHQIVSGSYFLDIKPYGLVNNYQNVQNIVVRIASAQKSNHSLLINCHFDSVPSSPGASDDGINCVAMLETLRVLSKRSTGPVHNIIFLFNGAEENPLQAAHGFITQHKWAKECRTVINLEAAGSNGRELLFQAGPGNDFIIKSYAECAPHPFAHSVGEELFQSNLIPSDTDFRLFRDFGNIPGLDFAFVRNGYVYHTDHDSLDKISPGSYQHVGDNLLALVISLSASPDLPHSTLKSKDKTVYFDFIGIVMIAYNEISAVYINSFAITLSLLVCLWSLHNLKQGSIYTLLIQIFLSGFAQSVGWIISIMYSLLIAFLLDYFFLTMSWYTRPKIIFGLYFCPTLVFSSLFLILLSLFNKKNDNMSIGIRSQIHGHTTRLIWTFFLFVSTIYAIRSSYLFLLPVVFNTFSFLIINILKLENTRRAWLNIYLFNLIMPILFAMYLTALLLQLFIPITARSGSNRNPEYIIGIFSTIGCIYITSFLFPLVTLLRRPVNVIIGLLLTSIITLGCIAFTQYGFPYGSDVNSPTPQRYWIFHTYREFHNISGAITDKNSGYFLLNMDRNSPHIMKNYVPEIKNAVSLTKDCDNVIFCGLPIFTSRMLSVLKESTWIPAPPPVIHEPVNMKLTSKQAISTSVRRYSFQTTGPDHYSIFVSPKPNIKIIQWSFVDNIPQSPFEWNGRPAYFILYGYGLRPDKPYTFWIDMEIPADWKDAVMDIAISGQYVHHEKTRTDDYKTFLNKFPAWAHTTAFINNYNSWVY